MKSIVMAVAAATLASGQAFAVGSPFPLTPNITLYISGASAQDKSLGLLLEELCANDNSLHTFLDGGTGKAQRAYYCNLDPIKVPGLSVANPKLMLYKRSAGGSGKGVVPVAEGTAMEFLKVDLTNADNNCMPTANPKEYNCGYNVTTNVMAVPDAGLSDVEPALFVGVNANPTNGVPAVTAAHLTKLVVNSMRAGVFGVPVTLALRDALQTAQGLDQIDPATGKRYEDAAHMPSLSKIQVASLMAKNGVKKWDALYVNGSKLNLATGVTPPSDLKVHICRRVAGSGTQAVFNDNFLGNPCTDGALVPADLTNNATGPVVVQGSGSGDVDVCLDGKNASNIWAVGLLSTESNANLAKGYRFIKIDGVAPTLENVWNNTNFNWAEETMQWRTVLAGGPNPADLTPGGGKDKLTILNTLATQAGKPTILSAINNPDFNHKFGDAGYLALYTNGYTPDTVWNAANPVTTASHGTPVNNCRVPLIGKPASLK